MPGRSTHINRNRFFDAEACLKPAAGSTMIMDHERPVRISNFEICEITAVLGCYRLWGVLRKLDRQVAIYVRCHSLFRSDYA
jgi:hypothetical protein